MNRADPLSLPFCTPSTKHGNGTIRGALQIRCRPARAESRAGRMAVAATLADEDLLREVLEKVDGETLSRCCAVSRLWHVAADDDTLWHAVCDAEKIRRQGSSRPGARTFTTWHATWLRSRCMRCFAHGKHSHNVGSKGYRCFPPGFNGTVITLCQACADIATSSYHGNDGADFAHEFNRLVSLWGNNTGCLYAFVRMVASKVIR